LVITCCYLIQYTLLFGHMKAEDQQKSAHSASDRLWKALADPTRRAILEQLRKGERSTSDLSESFSHLSRFAVMKHLEMLHQVGAISFRRVGKQRINKLETQAIHDTCWGWLLGLIGSEHRAKLTRLKTIIEKEP